jgi:hypothetical protein
MGVLDAVWHVLNFLAPAPGVALFAVLLARLFWRQEFRRQSLISQVAWPSLAGALVLIGGLALTGHDGRMSTYGALVVVNAGMLWWMGLRRR